MIVLSLEPLIMRLLSGLHDIPYKKYYLKYMVGERSIEQKHTIIPKLCKLNSILHVDSSDVHNLTVLSRDALK